MGRDGKHMGTGILWATPNTMQIVGVYYNKKLLKEIGGKVPQTVAEFNTLLTKSKAAGQVPLQQGDSDKSATFWLTALTWAEFLPPGSLAKMQLGAHGAAFTTGALRAASTLQYFGQFMANGYRGYDSFEGGKRFIQGQGLFQPTGSWATGDLSKGMGTNVGFFLPPARPSTGVHNAIVGPGQPWAIPTKAKHGQLAAIYLDFLMSKHAAQVFASRGDLPATALPALPPSSTPVGADVFRAYQYIARHKVGFSFWVGDPNVFEFGMPEGQKLLGGEEAPADYVKKIQGLLAKDLKANNG
jgi:raffinose/stachyose/melibiose transport system substrate-binding protein